MPRAERAARGAEIDRLCRAFQIDIRAGRQLVPCLLVGGVAEGHSAVVKRLQADGVELAVRFQFSAVHRAALADILAQQDGRLRFCPVENIRVGMGGKHHLAAVLLRDRPRVKDKCVRLELSVHVLAEADSVFRRLGKCGDCLGHGRIGKLDLLDRTQELHDHAGGIRLYDALNGKAVQDGRVCPVACQLGLDHDRFRA